MKIKFSKMERMAGLFVLVAVVAFVFSTVVVSVKQGWFSKHYHYKTMFLHGEGLHPGTLVQIAGLRAGTVDDVVLNDDDRIAVTFTVSHDFGKRIREDSVARVIRPFIIGDKVVEVTVGSADKQQVAEMGLVGSEETMDIMDILGGGKLGPLLTTLDSLMQNARVIAEAFGDPRRSKAFIGMFDEMLPTMRDFREMSQQMTKGKNLKKSMENMAKLTNDLNRMLPEFEEFSKQLPQLSANSNKAMEEVNKMAEELNKFLPVLVEIAPKLPEASQKSVEAMKEAVIVLRAMQKSFLLRGAVKDVKEEDAREESKKLDDIKKEQQREPANK